MHRFLVVEGKRLMPLLFLLVLLVSLSIYDNFFRQVEQPVTVPDDQAENILTFITADRGELDTPASFRVMQTMEEWTQFQEEHAGLPDYPFNELFEVAVSVMHGEIRSIQQFPQEDGMIQVQVRMVSQPRTYHVITVEREKIGDRSRWLFLDENDQILHEVMIPPAEEGEEAGT
ncbi:MAG: hypothetical protein KGZ32_02595 [Dethiobacter sp.]|jgi:hypothetical protein|nr:hypothetical protein [Dethiobacter sp.]